MKISVILGHPYAESLNTALATAVVSHLQELGHEVRFHNLHDEGFDPIMPPEELAGARGADPLVALHQREIMEAEGICIIHPNWWGQPPAILKGWIDRVLREDVAYRFPVGDSGGGLPIGMLKAGAAVVFNTSNTPALREDTVFGDPLHRIWKNCIFEFCGVTTFERRVFRVVAESTQAEREEWLEEARAIVGSLFPH